MTNLAWPVVGRTTDEFNPDRGYVPGLGDLGPHTGLDIAAPTGTPIKAAAPGVVTRVWWDMFQNGSPAGGNMVQVDHGNGLQTQYAHMRDTASVRVGAEVDTSTTVGLVGSSGAATGPHLHFVTIQNGKYVNPRNYLDQTTTTEEFPEMFYLIMQRKHTYLVIPQGSNKPRAILMGDEGAGANRDNRLPVINAHSAPFTMYDIKQGISGIRPEHLTTVK